MKELMMILRVIMTLYVILLIGVSTKNLKPRFGNHQAYLAYLKTLKLRNQARLKDHYAVSVFKSFSFQLVFLFLVACCVAQRWFYGLTFVISCLSFVEVLLMFTDYEFHQPFQTKEWSLLVIDRGITIVSYVFNWMSLIALIMTV